MSDPKTQVVSFTEPDCPHCKRQYPKGWTAGLKKRRSDAIKKALAETDETVGRPRTISYETVWRLRDKGMSIHGLANHFKIARGSIQNALRKKPKGESK